MRKSIMFVTGALLAGVLFFGAGFTALDSKSDGWKTGLPGMIDKLNANFNLAVPNKNGTVTNITFAGTVTGVGFVTNVNPDVTGGAFAGSTNTSIVIVGGTARGVVSTGGDETGVTNTSAVVIGGTSRGVVMTGGALAGVTNTSGVVVGGTSRGVTIAGATASAITNSSPLLLDAVKVYVVGTNIWMVWSGSDSNIIQTR